MRIVKIGGSYLTGPERYEDAASWIGSLAAEPTVVVASAMAGVTESLLGAALQDAKDPQETDALVSWGEIESARSLQAAARRNNIPATLVDPEAPNWPIRTDSRFGEANPRPVAVSRAKNVLLPILDSDRVAILPGYVGKDAKGRLTTMGRGGSDLTAVFLAAALRANRLIVVKGRPGVALPHNVAVNGDFLQTKAAAALPKGLAVEFVYPFLVAGTA